jgi:hypothetical protein
MWAGIRRFLSLVAIAAIALHAVLPVAIAGLAVAGAPAGVICHSGAPAADACGIPQPGDFTPAPSCDHCALCGAMPLLRGPDGTPIARLAPARLVAVLQPESAAPRVGFDNVYLFARGPPHLS